MFFQTTKGPETKKDADMKKKWMTVSYVKLSLFKKSLRIIHTVNDVLFPHRLHRFHYDVFVAVIDLSHQFLQS